MSQRSRKNESWSKKLRSLGKGMDNEFELGKKAEKGRKAEQLKQSREKLMIDGSKKADKFEVERSKEMLKPK